jgi:hypothetical protein
MKKILLIVGGLIILGAAYYAISPLFITIERDDALPPQEEAVKSGGTETGADTTGGPLNGSDGTATEESAVPVQQSSAVERALVTATTGHPASGFVRVVESSTDTIVRFEEYETINGPDLFVYLSKDLEASEFVNLGEIRGTKGNINYTVPEGVNIDEYPYVLVWCRAFSVLFNYAKIN